jgi:nicotinamide-nucleotide amidase
MKRPASQMNKDQDCCYHPNTALLTKWYCTRNVDEKKIPLLFQFPGVPYEMKYLVDNEIIPKL